MKQKDDIGTMRLLLALSSVTWFAANRSALRANLMNTQLFAKLLALCLVSQCACCAADGDWLSAFPIDEEHREYGRVIGQIAAQPLFYLDSRYTNVVASFRCLTLSSWGFNSVTFLFTRGNDAVSTNKNGITCYCETKEWGKKEIATNSVAVAGQTAENLLKTLESQEVFSRREILNFDIQSRPRPLVYSADAEDIIIERWNKTSYLSIMRQGIYRKYHEESVKVFTKYCFDTASEIRAEHRR